MSSASHTSPDSAGAASKGSLRRRLLLALGVTLVCLALVEALLRLFLGNLEVAPFVLDPGDGRCVALEPGGERSYDGMLLRIPPVVHAVNELGYRGAPRPEAAPPGSTRVLALGDSFTFGQGVLDEQALPAALETELARSRPELEVLNFGIPGLNLAEIIDQYRYFASRWEAEQVVLFLFENDLDQPLCDLLERRVFIGLIRRSRLARLVVLTLAPDTLGTPNPHPSEARSAQLRAQLLELRGLVHAQGSELLLVSLADPLADAKATRSIAEQLELPALVFERDDFEAYEVIPNESHWTAEATRAAASEIAAWMRPQLGQPSERQ